jgi:hypothetical protein
MKDLYIPNHLLHIILEYDGRIKYRKGEYINIFHKNDLRYNMINPIILKKKKIMEKTEISGSGFYFDFSFDICNSIGLVYDYNFSYQNIFEICYYDMRNDWEQIRTYL